MDRATSNGSVSGALLSRGGQLCFSPARAAAAGVEHNNFLICRESREVLIEKESKTIRLEKIQKLPPFRDGL